MTVYKQDLDYATKMVLQANEENVKTFKDMTLMNRESAKAFMVEFRSIMEAILIELFKINGKETPLIIRGLIYLESQFIINPKITAELVHQIRGLCYFDYYREVAREELARRNLPEESYIYKVVMGSNGVSITEGSLESGTTSAMDYLLSQGSFKYYKIKNIEGFNSVLTDKQRNIAYMVLIYALAEGTNILDLLSPNFTERYYNGEVSNEEAIGIYNKCYDLFKERKLYITSDEEGLPIEVIDKGSFRRKNPIPRKATFPNPNSSNEAPF